MDTAAFDLTLLSHAKAHPSMQPRDAVKLCYQSAHGAEHLLTDREVARGYLREEFAHTPATDEPLCEPIGGGYARVNVGAWKQKGLPEEWLLRLFCLTAEQPAAPDAEMTFAQMLHRVETLAIQGLLPFSAGELHAFVAAYEASGGGAVHHSQAYRDGEHPAYRVVHARYIALLPVLELLARLPQGEGAQVIAIDGRAASGKTTLAKALSQVLDAGVIHMDDFFLPPALRTPQRLQEPGGNVHHERFAAEVLPWLKQTAAFAYTRFDCAVMELGERRQVAASPWRIVEGSYSCHPALGAYMDVRLFCDVDPAEQMCRVTLRDGAEMAERFANEWIPMEESYFTAFAVAERAALTLTL